MKARNDKHEFIFPVSRNTVLTNDLVLRRDILELLPLPLALAIQGEWVWHNRSTEHVTHWAGEDLLAVVQTVAQEAAETSMTFKREVPWGASQLTVTIHPIENFDGQVVGQLGWLDHSMAGIAMDQMETAVLAAREGVVIWSNAAARRAFDLGEAHAWDDLEGFPDWDDAIHGLTVVRRRHFHIRCLAVGSYVLVEAWQPKVATEHDSMPMEQVASFVHEIRNPLAALSGYVEMAQMEASNASIQYYEQMMYEIDRLSRLTTDMMSVSRPLSVAPDWVLLDAMVEIAWFAAGCGRRKGRRTIHLKKSYAPDRRVWADRDRLQQVLTNLVKNAVEAMADVGTYVEIGCRQEDHETVISVVDNGPGIPPDLLRRLFYSRFTTKDSGNGLGLMIVRRIVEAHGGTVQVSAGDGTAIKLALPLPREVQ